MGSSVTTTWETYHAPGFVHPDFLYYSPTLVPGTPGPRKTYPNHYVGSAFDHVDPTVLRMGRGKSFLRKYPNDPCPLGWTQDPSRAGVCVETPSYQGIFYTDEAWLPQAQGGRHLPTQPRSRGPYQSQPGDVRLANSQGGYDVTYESKPKVLRRREFVSNSLSATRPPNHQPRYLDLPGNDSLI